MLPSNRHANRRFVPVGMPLISNVRPHKRLHPMPINESPRDFERRVAALYRMLGAEVAHDYSLAGSQIDVFVQERTPSGGLIRTAVECKSYSAPVGIDVVRSLAGLAALLKQRN